MTQHDDSLYFVQMLDAAREATSFVEGITKQEFLLDLMRQRATIYSLQIVGEAARRVSTTGRALVSDVAWHEIIGMRHPMVHDYLRVDLDVVWKSATVDARELVLKLEPIVKSLQRS